jgi:type II secretory pathway component PulF|tara:strand:+ start:125 stop:307 length:183 start_codon:yes stop_codon:yes gene_type:complete
MGYITTKDLSGREGQTAVARRIREEAQAALLEKAIAAIEVEKKKKKEPKKKKSTVDNKDI